MLSGTQDTNAFNNGWYDHFNNYRNPMMRNQQWVDTSSVYRSVRVYEMAPLRSVEDVVLVLGDTKNTKYPIYRDGEKSRSGST